MRKRIALLISAFLFSLSLCAAQAEVPAIDDQLFVNAKQALVYFGGGDFESAADLLGFADAEELSKFVTGNYTTIGAGVQTAVSVAYSAEKESPWMSVGWGNQISPPGSDNRSATTSGPSTVKAMVPPLEVRPCQMPV